MCADLPTKRMRKTDFEELVERELDGCERDLSTQESQQRCNNERMRFEISLIYTHLPHNCRPKPSIKPLQTIRLEYLPRRRQRRARAFALFAIAVGRRLSAGFHDFGGDADEAGCLERG
jgi:hypothetical protein